MCSILLEAVKMTSSDSATPPCVPDKEDRAMSHAVNAVVAKDCAHLLISSSSRGTHIHSHSTSV